jgi:anti-anti-sigma factor
VPSLTVVRRALDDWLAGIGPLADDRDAVHMAVVEVVTNAIEHAYPVGRPGTVVFDVGLQPDGQMECRVSDYGRWHPPDPAATDRGNGLMVARHMVELQISHPADADGAGRRAPSTVVTLRHRLRRPAMLASDSSAEPASFPAGEDFAVEAELEGTLACARVRGAIDISTADELLRKLLAACRGGTVALTVDLSGVTQLASAGVSALYELTRQLAVHRRDLRLIASAGGVAGSVLDLVGLRYSPAT